MYLEETESKRNLLKLAVDSTSYVSYSMNIISAVCEVVCQWGSTNTGWHIDVQHVKTL